MSSCSAPDLGQLLQPDECSQPGIINTMARLLEPGAVLAGLMDVWKSVPLWAVLLSVALLGVSAVAAVRDDPLPSPFQC